MDNKPIKSARISAGTRVYYFDVRKDKKEQSYITISEIPTERAPGKRKRQHIFVHEQNLDDFIKAFTELSDHIKNEAK